MHNKSMEIPKGGYLFCLGSEKIASIVSIFDSREAAIFAKENENLKLFCVVNNILKLCWNEFNKLINTQKRLSPVSIFKAPSSLS